jgi:hypothetical protein
MSNIFLGLDPGLGGGLAAITPNGLVTTKMPDTERDIWRWVHNWNYIKAEVFSVIEKQDPRPTKWFDKETKKWRQSVLKSTCLLYGNYMSLRGMITAAGITLLEDCPPKRWQSALQISPRKKGESTWHWKSRLRQRAEQANPETKITMQTADAVLLSEYCRLLYKKSENDN